MDGSGSGVPTAFYEVGSVSQGFVADVLAFVGFEAWVDCHRFQSIVLKYWDDIVRISCKS